MTAGLRYAFFGCIRELRAKHVAHGVTNLEHPPDPRADRNGYAHRLERAATHHDLAVVIGEAALFDRTGGGNLVGL